MTLRESSQSLRPIAALDLLHFRKPRIPGNRNVVWRSAWYLINAFVFRSAIFGLLPNSLKAELLRLFGARVGIGLVCKPCVSIKYPWLLTIGDHVWIGEEVWIDNLSEVTIGSNVCLSQGVKIFTGSHDWNSAEFPFFARPVRIGDHVWVTAFCKLRPGVEIPPRFVVLSDLNAGALRGLRQTDESA